MPAENAAEHDELRWWIPCTDPDDEDHRVTVLVLGDRVAVVLPPGYTLIFEPGEARDLASLLDKAAGYAVITN